MRTPLSSQTSATVSPAMQKDPELPDYQSEAYTAGSTATMSPSPPTSMGDSPDQILWPGNTYIVTEKTSRLAMTLDGNRLSLTEITEDKVSDDQRWLCVEKDGYFGLYNTKARVYVGHDDRGNMRALVRNFKDWEFLMPRRHPNGGYQLMSPHGKTMKMIVIAEEDRRIVRTDHGDTLWEFRRV